MLEKLKTAALALAWVLAATSAIAATPTTNYSWLKPAVGADANAWGTDLNGDLDGIDSTVFGMCPKAGCTYTGLVTFNLGLTSLTTVDATTPNNGSTGGLRLRGNATSGNAFLQVTDSTGGNQWGYASITNAGTWAWTGAISASGGFSGNLTGNASGNAATASQWQTTRTETLSGDVSGSASVNGAGNWTIGTTLANSGVGAGVYGSSDGQHYAAVQFDAKGRAISAATYPISYPNPTAAQLFSILGLTSSGGGQIGSVTIPTANGNVIINWGWFSSMGAGGNNTATFTTSYTSGAIGIATGAGNACAANVISNSQITIHNDSSGVQNCYWLSIGT